MQSHLSTAKKDAAFALEMTAKCTKLKVLELAAEKSFIFMGRIAFPTQSFLNVLNKSTSLQSLSLEGIKLSDIVSPL